MLYDPKGIRSKRALRQQLNRAVVVPSFPLDSLSERENAAIGAWLGKIFELYEIDPTSPTRWERAVWSLALDLFPNFAVVGLSNVGRPSTKPAVMELFYKFQTYQQKPGRKGSKYKNFLHDHRAECEACKLKSDRALKGAMLRAQRQHELGRQGEEFLLRFGAMRALGLK
jgi:hypothetical protein